MMIPLLLATLAIGQSLEELDPPTSDPVDDRTTEFEEPDQLEAELDALEDASSRLLQLVALQAAAEDPELPLEVIEELVRAGEEVPEALESYRRGSTADAATDTGKGGR